MILQQKKEIKKLKPSSESFNFQQYLLPVQPNRAKLFEFALTIVQKEIYLNPFKAVLYNFKNRKPRHREKGKSNKGNSQCN
jgi:hypothetical protein